MRWVYAVVGKDRFLRSEALRRILDRYKDDLDPLGPTRVGGPGAEIASVFDDVRTRSLLGARRAVVVEESDEFISRHRGALEKFCASVCDSGVLILLCESLPKNTRLFKLISEFGEVVPCESPKGRALASWVIQRAKSSYGKHCTEPAALRLVQHLGPSPGALDAELAKLASYVGERSDVTPDDVDAMTGHLREELVFSVTDAVESGNASAAFTTWHQVLSTDRAAQGRAIGGISWGVRRLLDAHRDLHRGVPETAVAQRFFTDPAALKRRLEMAPVPRLIEQQRDLLAGDLAVKTGAATPEAVVERFIMKHASARAVAHRS